jgi:hypothetical protein
MDVFLSETPMSLIDKILMVFGVRRESARDVQRQRKIRFLLNVLKIYVMYSRLKKYINNN